MPYTDNDDSSVDTPPPPPPSDGGSITDQEAAEEEEQRYQRQLQIFKGMSKFSTSNSRDEEDRPFDVDDSTVELPPPEKYEEMGMESKDHRPNRCYMVAVCFLVLIAVILGAGFGTGAFTNEKSSTEKGTETTTPPADDEPVETPPPDTREGRIYSHIAAVSLLGDNVMANPTSGEARAIQWLIDEDPLSLDPLDFSTHFRIEQRYALLTLWFSSAEPWSKVSNWLSEDECTWHGVTCGDLETETRKTRNLQGNTSSTVTAIEIEDNNIVGTIPQDLSVLVDLQRLNLRNNFVRGTLPSVLERLSQLNIMTLNGNALTGDLTGFNFASFPSLRILDLSSNDFSGPLPTSFYSLPALEILVLDDNTFSGGISTNIGSLQLLGK